MGSVYARRVCTSRMLALAAWSRTRIDRRGKFCTESKAWRCCWPTANRASKIASGGSSIATGCPPGRSGHDATAARDAAARPAYWDWSADSSPHCRARCRRPGEAIPASHYADRQHASSRPEPLPAPRIHQPELQRQTAAIAKPTNFGEILSRFHTQLAPHAGLIVALALIAAGGLLYWMIVGPAQTPPPNWQGDSQEFGQDTLLGKETFSLPNALTPNSPERLTAQGGLAQPENLTNNWQTVPLPGPPQTLSPPTASAPTLAPSQATGQLQFPATSHPQGLDFTKIGTQPMRAIDLKAPSLLPAVAQGSTATKNR